MGKTLLTWPADVSLVLGIAVLAFSVLLVPEVILLGEEEEPIEPAPAPLPCEGDGECEAGTGNREKCYYHLLLGRCTQNGDRYPLGIINDLCSVTSKPEQCAGCRCRKYIPRDGDDYSCRCE